MHGQRRGQAAQPTRHDRWLAAPTAQPPRPACRAFTWLTSTTRCSTASPAARGSETLVETEIENNFVPGPVTVYNTVGEVRGSEKPDEIVVLGAHLDSWDLAQGTTDNGTGSCVVLESGPRHRDDGEARSSTEADDPVLPL